jgi:hypothetical protein
MELFSGRFLTIHVILIVEPVFIKISPTTSPSGTPRICVMGSKNIWIPNLYANRRAEK